MKRTVCLILALVMVLINLPINTFATERISETNHTGVSGEVFAYESSNFEDVETETQEERMPYGEREVVEVLQTQSVVLTTIPSGQPTNGYRFPDYGGSVYVKLDGGPTTSIGVSLAWDVVSINLNVGLASESASIGGVAVNFPASNYFHKVQLTHYITAKYLKIDYYKYNEYLSTSYVTKYTVDGIEPSLLRTS